MYCKFNPLYDCSIFSPVLIVAKCIVNAEVVRTLRDTLVVLIVAKCIVNL